MISLDATHPSLSGLRLFMYPVGFADSLGWNNLCPLYRFTNQNGLDSASAPGAALGAHPSILTGLSSPTTTSAGYYSYWNDVWPDDSVKDITVIARVVYRGGDPGSGAGGFICGARGSGNNGGFLFGVWDAGGSDEGVAVFLYSLTGSPWVFTDQLGFTNVTNTPMTVGFTYASGEQRLTLFRDGTVTRTATDTSKVYTPYVNEAAKQFTIGRADVGFGWPGEVGWVMVFAGCLQAARVSELMRDAEWPFVWEDPLWLLEVAEDTFVTTLTVGSVLTESGDATIAYFTTAVDAEAIVSGDFTIEPEDPTVGTFVTSIGVGSRAYVDFPEFGVFITGVGVGSSITATAPVTFITSVGIRSDARGLVDGRTDLIDTEHYRR